MLYVIWLSSGCSMVCILPSSPQQNGWYGVCVCLCVSPSMLATRACLLNAFSGISTFSPSGDGGSMFWIVWCNRPFRQPPQPPHAREFTVRIYRLFRELPPKCRANIIVIVIVDVVVVSAIAGYRILRYANMHASTALTHQTKKCALLRIFVYIWNDHRTP